MPAPPPLRPGLNADQRLALELLSRSKYAMGWTARGEGGLWHTGSNLTWYAEALFETASGIVAAAACNDGDLVNSMPAVGSALLEAAAAV